MARVGQTTSTGSALQKLTVFTLNDQQKTGKRDNCFLIPYAAPGDPLINLLAA